MTHDQEREKFEAWAVDETDLVINRLSDGTYSEIITDRYWVVWQAAKREPVVSGEAVAWMYSVGTRKEILFREFKQEELRDGCTVTPLYTHTPEAKDAERYRELLEAAELAVCRPQAVNALAYQRLYKAIAALTTPRGG